MAEGLNNLPLVSIVVPVFNGERYLRESLDSILSQTYPRTEILVMDDASSDSTPTIVASYGDRINYHRQPLNRGNYGNVNDGILKTRGEYIAIYHADDIYHPTTVEREVEFLQRYSEVGAVFCQAIYIDDEGGEIGRYPLPRELRGGRPLDYAEIFNTLLIYKNRFLPCPSSMVCASVYRDVGPYRDEEFHIGSDLEMWLRIARKYPLGILEEYLLRYRHGHDNWSGRYNFLRTEAEPYFKIMDIYLEEHRSLASEPALDAYEAHRAEDQLMIVINHYILNQQEAARVTLNQVRARQILGGSGIQLGRLLVSFMVLHGLLLLPRISLVASLFYRRWYKGNDLKQPGKGE